MAEPEDDGFVYEDAPAWDRKPDEGQKPYAAFLEYRAQSPHARSLREVAQKIDKSLTIVGRWSVDWDWVARTDAWDLAEEKERQRKKKQEIDDANTRHTRVAQVLQSKLIERLQGMRPEEISPATAAQWLDVTVRVERLALGISTQNHSHTGKDGGPMELLHGAKERLASILNPLAFDDDEPPPSPPAPEQEPSPESPGVAGGAPPPVVKKAKQPRRPRS